MSQRSTASHPVSRPSTEAQNVRPSSGSFHGQREQQTGADHSEEAPPEQNLQQLSPTTVAHATAQSYTPVSYGDDRANAVASRGVGVHTMLNPTEPETSRANSTLGTNVQATMVDRSPSQHAAASEILRPASRLKRPHSPGPSSVDHGPSGKSRKVLIPKPPRSVSLGNMATGSWATSDRLPSVHESGRQFAPVLGPGSSSEAPPLPTLPAHNQNISSFPPPISAPPLNRRASVATIGGLARPPHPHPQSTSPSPNSAYSSQPSPASIYQTGQPPSSSSYFPGSTLRGAFAAGDSPQVGQLGTEGPYTTPLSSGIPLQVSPSGGYGSNYKIMPIPGQNGEFFVPVEVETASKAANEKRQRNAQASARFRYRKKGKEEAAKTNAKVIEQQLKESADRNRQMETLVNFYRSERNRMRDILYNNPATRDHALQAPRSPTFAAPSQPQPPEAPLGAVLQTPGNSPGQARRPARRGQTESKTGQGYALPPTTAYPPVSYLSYQPPPEGRQTHTGYQSMAEERQAQASYQNISDSRQPPAGYQPQEGRLPHAGYETTSDVRQGQPNTNHQSMTEVRQPMQNRLSWQTENAPGPLVGSVSAAPPVAHRTPFGAPPTGPHRTMFDAPLPPTQSPSFGGPSPVSHSTQFNATTATQRTPYSSYPEGSYDRTWPGGQQPQPPLPPGGGNSQEQ